MPEHLAALQRGNAATALVPVQPRGAPQDPSPLIWAAGPVLSQSHCTFWVMEVGQNKRTKERLGGIFKPILFQAPAVGRDTFY